MNAEETLSTDSPASSLPEAAQTALLGGLFQVASAAASATSPEEALDGVIHALLDAGLILGAVGEIHGSPRLRRSAGQGFDPADLARLSALAAAESTHQQTRRGSRRLYALCVPTRSSPEAWLYLQAETDFAPALLQSLSDLLVLALDRLHLTEQTSVLHKQADQRIREVATIYEIGRAIDGVEIGRLLEIITEKAARVMNAQACSLMRLNPTTQALGIAASYGLSEDVVFVSQRTLGEGIAGLVAQTGDPMVIVDGRDDPRLSGVALRPEIGSSMIVPMKDESGRVIGVLSIRRRRPAPDFTKEDLQLFSVFASQAALVISNKQLYDDLRQHVKELSTISELTQAVISNLDLNLLLESVADSIIETVQFDRCCIYLYDRQTRRFVPRILRGYHPDTIGRNPVRMGEGVVGIAAKRKMTIVESNARDALQPMRGFARSLGTNAFIALPIISNPVYSRGQTIGVVVADNKLSGRPIQPLAVELLTTFVSHAGIAIENAQLYEDSQQKFQEINRLATQTDNILRSVTLAVVVIDPAGRVTRWNQAADVVLGLRESEAVGYHYEECIGKFTIPPEEAALMKEWMRLVNETGEPLQKYRVRFHPAGGAQEIIAHFLLSPLIDRHGVRQGTILIVEDITREIKMEMEFERMRRLADIGQLAAKMAHEVRNPLSSIKGAAQFMRGDTQEAGPLREFLDIIIEEVNHLTQITTDLLEFARPMKRDLRWVSLNDLMKKTLRLFSPMLKESRIKVNFRPDAEVPDICIDAKLIEQVLRNIIINALQAMPGGGDLAITTYHSFELRTATICFCDTGIGIPPDKLDQIFQPFMTTKTKGTGLGLAIVRRIVENHNGEIEVTSRPGEGTCFSITLPFESKEEPAPLPELEPAQPGFGSDLPDL